MRLPVFGSAFFMISGYFCYRRDGQTDYGKKIRHILTLILYGAVLYSILAVALQELYPLTIKGIFDWILFNEPEIIAPQMWFLFAFLYDYAFFVLIEKYKAYKIAYACIPLGDHRIHHHSLGHASVRDQSHELLLSEFPDRRFSSFYPGLPDPRKRRAYQYVESGTDPDDDRIDIALSCGTGFAGKRFRRLHRDLLSGRQHLPLLPETSRSFVFFEVRKNTGKRIKMALITLLSQDPRRIFLYNVFCEYL